MSIGGFHSRGVELGGALLLLHLHHPSYPCQQLAHVRLQLVVELETLRRLSQKILISMVASYQRTNHVFPCSHNIVHFKPGVCVFCISFSHCPVRKCKKHLGDKCFFDFNRPDDVLLSGNILFDKGNNSIMFLQLLLEHLLLILVTTPAFNMHTCTSLGQ